MGGYYDTRLFLFFLPVFKQMCPVCSFFALLPLANVHPNRGKKNTVATANTILFSGVNERVYTASCNLKGSCTMVAKPYIPLFQLPITKLRPHQPNSRGCSRVSCCSCRLQQPNEHLPNVITKTSSVKFVKCLRIPLRTQPESAIRHWHQIQVLHLCIE